MKALITPLLFNGDEGGGGEGGVRLTKVVLVVVMVVVVVVRGEERYIRGEGSVGKRERGKL